MRRVSLLNKRAYYGGYPVVRRSEKPKARDSAVSRSAEQQATLESNSPDIYASQSRTMVGDRAVKPNMDRVSTRRKRKRKGRPPRDAFTTALLSRSDKNPQVSPATSNAFRLDQATLGRNSDTMGMLQKGAAQLRHLAKRKKARKSMDIGVQGSEKYREGGALPSNDGSALYDQGIGSRHQTRGGIRPGTWG